MAMLPQPDRTRGLFETLLVLDERPIELEAHLERLATSLRELFGADLPAALADRVRERARGVELGRMRVTVDPGSSESRLEGEDVDPATFFPGEERTAVLRSLPSQGGLGRHKWADRRRLRETAGGPVSLVLDGDDEVLEAGRANVFVAHEGVLKTPAADGRILPGIARAGAIAVAGEAGIEVAEVQLSRNDLLAADEVFLTGSVRGVEPAGSLDGTPLSGTGEISRRVAAGLRRRWQRDPSSDAAPAPATGPRPGQLVR